MKLRVYDNSIRLRLSRSEVARVASGEPIDCVAMLTPRQLVYRLAAGDANAVHFDGSTLSIQATFTTLQSWATGDDVGLSIADASGVAVLIEKDFQCLHGDADDQSDCFANPLADASA